MTITGQLPVKKYLNKISQKKLTVLTSCLVLNKSKITKQNYKKPELIFSLIRLTICFLTFCLNFILSLTFGCQLTADNTDDDNGCQLFYDYSIHSLTADEINNKLFAESALQHINLTVHCTLMQ